MLDNLPSLSQTVDIHGLRANKSLGQHFLLDMNVTDKIARLAAPLGGVNVAEIGPGPGGLTRALIQNGAQVLAIEMDERFLAPLDDIARASGKLDVIQADGLKVDIAEHLSGEIKLSPTCPIMLARKCSLIGSRRGPYFGAKLC